MAIWEPRAELDARYSSPEAAPIPWTMAREELERAETYWLTTVRPDGRPHVTPLIAIWLAGTLYFCTGEEERKAKNLAQNLHCAITTGCNLLNKGLDVVIEGETTRVRGTALLEQIAAAYDRKYGSAWHFDVVGDAFQGAEGNIAAVYAITPVTAFGFGKGELASQTRWRFTSARE